MTTQYQAARIGKRELGKIARSVSDRDRHILESLKAHKYLTTEQIRKLHFAGETTEKNHETDTTRLNADPHRLAALRAANRTLAKLRSLGAINHLARRIGGVRAGSGSFVWTLTATGARLIALLAGTLPEADRKRFYEPSPNFLTHILAVAQTSIRLAQICRDHNITLADKQTEPNCWRQYTNISGLAAWLRPDLFAVTSNHEFIDCWFLEIDLATESPSTVLKKCEQYLAYKQSGQEQQKCGVFPYVVWIVPSIKRRESLARHISENLRGETKPFLFITMDELENLILQGAEMFRQKEGAAS